MYSKTSAAVVFGGRALESFAGYCSQCMKPDRPEETLAEGIIGNAFRMITLRPPDERETHDLSDAVKSSGFDSAIKNIEKIAASEKVGQLDARQLCQRALNCFTFYQQNIGSLNELGDTRHIIVSPPKCGTTTLARCIRNTGQKVFAVHNDGWLRRYMPNGLVMEAFDLRFSQFFKCAQPRKPTLYFGFREPLSWYLSLAAELNLPLDAELTRNICDKFESEYPWNTLSFDSSRSLLGELTGMDLMDLAFDRDVGFQIYDLENFELALYRVESLEGLLTKLAGRMPIDMSRRTRLHEQADYIGLLRECTITPSEFDALFSNPLVDYFYPRPMLESFKRQYLA